MKTSITAIERADWHTPLVLRGDFTKSIAEAAHLGYQGIELHIPDPDCIDRKRIGAALRENHIELTSIGTGPSYSQERIFMTSPCPEVRNEAVRRMIGHIRLGAEFGAVVIIGLIKGQKKDVMDEAVYREHFDASMEICVKEAERQGAVIVFEVIDRFESDWLNTVEEGLQLLERIGSDYLKLHLDTFHMNIEEADCGACIRRAAKKIGHLHISDSDRWYPGHAHYDFDGTFSALKEIGYDGAAALESFAYPEPETAARLGLEKMRALIGQGR